MRRLRVMVNYDPSEISLSKALELIKPYEKAFVIDETDDKMLLGYRLIIPKMYSENPLLREIRGIVFNKEDGKVLQRPFHKFFNYGEVNCEAKPSDKGFITEKLDGSMIATTWHNNDLLISITKGLNHIAVSKAKNYIMSNPQYLELIKSFKGYTLLFEYLQSSYSVVIPYEKDELVLLALRNIKTGEYMPLDEVEKVSKEFNIPCVRVIKQDTLENIASLVREWEGKEGVVVYTCDDLVKIKSEWYLKRHNLITKPLSPKRIVELYFKGELDDIYPLLSDVKKQRVDELLNNVNSQLPTIKIVGLPFQLP